MLSINYLYWYQETETHIKKNNHWPWIFIILIYIPLLGVYPFDPIYGEGKAASFLNPSLSLAQGEWDSYCINSKQIPHSFLSTSYQHEVEG